MKIVELLIDELEDIMGFDAVALVHSPAHEAEFHAFDSKDVDDAIAFQVIKQAVLEHMDIDAVSLPDYTNEATGSIIAEEFESFNDYPESATNAAKRALKWRDEHPDNDCGTRVGWARANQLANRENISEETIARMASFARHLQHEDVPYSEGCGGLMVDAWGGRAGIEWAKNKLEDIREGLSQEFSYYDDLPSKVLDKLIEKLLEVGITKDSLLTDGYEFYDEPQKFALPSKSSANPDAATSDVNGDYKILYEYKGPKDSKNRDFCRRLLDLNMMFRLEDIQRMSITGANSEEFGYYDIFQYKGSFGCRHRWTKKYVYRKKNDRLLETAGLLLADNQNFSKEKYEFALDGEQQLIVGSLMIPEKLIFRVDENNEPYYVYFSKETIKQIAQKMMKEKLLDRVNLEHDPDSPIESHMVESWIVEDRLKDKQQAYGFDYPEGTWMGMYKVENPIHWEMVKQGKVKGFSIEGYFADKLIQK